MKMIFLKAKAVEDLISNIRDNLELYRSGNFNSYTEDQGNYFESEFELNEQKLNLIDCDNNDDREVENCILIYEAMGNLSSYLARDERLWTYITHTFLLNYSRKRWPIPEDDAEAVKHIKTHFFCIGARGIERDNASSRLWWLAALARRVSGLSFEEALTCFLFQSDVRANIVERPTTSQSINVFSVILNKLNQSYKSDKKLFERERFRKVMKMLNLSGGVKLLEALPVQSIENILDECISKAE